MRSWEFLAVVAILSTALSVVSLQPASSAPSCLNSGECTNLNTSAITCSNGRHVNNILNCSDLCVNDTNGSQCATFDSNECIEALCNGANCSTVDTYVPAACDDGNICTKDMCNACANNCSGQCTHTPLNNTKTCNLPLGDQCGQNGQCLSNFCADDVCCNAPCDGPAQACNLPGSVGQCVTAAPAPAVSWRGLVVIVSMLAAVGMLGLRRAWARKD